jgi:asparagine synthase (glutamine-hydrolysing)
MPVAGPGALSLWRLAKRAAGHTRVVLTGTGGDELFAGYARAALVLGLRGRWTEGYEPLAARIDAAGDDMLARHRAAADRAGDLLPLLAPDFLASLPELDWPAHGVDASDIDPVERLVHVEVVTTLPMLFHVEDRVLMAHGLEGRPVLSLGDVPAVAAALPAWHRVGTDGEGKVALRRVLEGKLPDPVRLDRRKRGFPTPFARAARGAGREMVEDILADRRFQERGWWNVDACRRLLDEERASYDRALYALLSWELWARTFLDGPSPATTQER